jgi:rfaE bifunctional protein kinase chain/domain
MAMTQFQPQSLVDRVRDFTKFRVAVIGDLMLDKYIWGRATRISQEAPVPVVCVDRQNIVPGGAANVVRNLLALEARANAIGVIGNDHDGDNLTTILDDAGADTKHISRQDDRMTTVKTRVIAANQQVVRIDFEDTTCIAEQCQKQILENVRECLEQQLLDAIILEDYAKGVFTPELMDEIAKLGNQANIPVTLDPHSSHPFNIKGISLMTPNRQEAFALAEIPYQKCSGDPTKDKALLQVGKILKDRWQNKMLLITLGGDGMALFLDDDPVPIHIPTRARQVFDVSGAGDTVMATMTLALLAGAAPEEAAVIANHAAGVVVGLVGTAPIYADALLDAIQQSN